MIEYKLQFKTREEYRPLRTKIQEDIQTILGDHSFLMDVAVNEAVNNALLYNALGMPVTFNLRVTDGRRLIIRIKDNGTGFDSTTALKKISESPHSIFEEKLYEESGRGLPIMNAAADKLYVNKKGNEVLLMKFIPESDMYSMKDEVFN